MGLLARLFRPRRWVCDFCGAEVRAGGRGNAGGRGSVALIEEGDALADFEKKGLRKHKSGPSQELRGEAVFVACPQCVRRYKFECKCAKCGRRDRNIVTNVGLEDAGTRSTSYPLLCPRCLRDVAGAFRGIGPM